MKEEYEKTQSSIKELIKNLDETKEKFNILSTQNASLVSELEFLQNENKSINKEKEDFRLEIEDLQSDKQIILKKSQNVS